MKTDRNNLLITYSGLLIFYAFLLLPIAWLVFSSFRNSDSILSGRLLPYLSELTISNYVEAFRISNLITFLGNSFLIAISVMLLVVFLGSLGAYALSRFALKGKNIFMMLALMPQFFPYVLILIPFYVLMSNLGLVDSHVGLILTHTSITLPFALWMLTGYFNAIPRELDQAASIDGCSESFIRLRSPAWWWRAFLRSSSPGAIICSSRFFHRAKRPKRFRLVFKRS